MPNGLIEAEALINASLIQRPDLIDEISLSYEDFHDVQYGTIYRVITWLYEKGKTISPITVLEKIVRRDDIDDEHRNTAVDITLAQTWAVKDMARIIREASMRRKAIAAGHKLLEVANTAERIDDDTLAECQRIIDEVIDGGEQDEGPKHIAELVQPYWDAVDERMKNKGRKRGADAGIPEFNYTVGGFVPGWMIVVAARPSMGKSAFMLHTAMAASVNDYAIVYSVEMGEDSLLDRVSAAEADLHMYDVVNGRLKDDDYALFVNALARLEKRNVYIDTNAYATTGYIRSKTRRLLRKLDPSKRVVVFVDYLQIIQSSSKGRSRNEEIGQISQELKAMAKELNVCVVALAQLNRAVDSRSDKRPTLGDIRDSGQIEQDADVVAFLYRDDYYNPQSPTKDVLEIIVAKNRNGSTATINVAYFKDKQRIIGLSGVSQ